MELSFPWDTWEENRVEGRAGLKVKTLRMHSRATDMDGDKYCPTRNHLKWYQTPQSHQDLHMTNVLLVGKTCEDTRNHETLSLCLEVVQLELRVSTLGIC